MPSSSMMLSNPVPNPDRFRRRKKKSLSLNHQASDRDNKNRWKTAAEQQIYSSKLLEALRRVRRTPPPSTSSFSTSPNGGRAVREAADRALAVAAKGRTRWSRAILTNRIKLNFMKNKRQKVTAKSRPKPKKPSVSVVGLRGKLPVVQRKVRFLGRLVPGCRKESLPVILEETTDYIAALQMQVRAMTALAQLLSLSGASEAAFLNRLSN